LGAGRCLLGRVQGGRLGRAGPAFSCYFVVDRGSCVRLLLCGPVVGLVAEAAAAAVCVCVQTCGLSAAASPSPPPRWPCRFEIWSPQIHQLLDKDKPTIVLCHHGVRSMQVRPCYFGGGGRTSIFLIADSWAPLHDAPATVHAACVPAARRATA
jgi:hypothetical protein